MPATDIWQRRLLTAQAMVAIGIHALRVNLQPFARWRTRYRRLAEQPPLEPFSVEQAATARDLAKVVERAALRLPFATKCLPQALALSQFLHRRRLPHCVVIAARPDQSEETDKLHAWVEAGGEVLIGDLPGPWLVVTRLSPRD